MNQTPGVDFEQVINLMKSILSLEYCLQYQIIPLNIEQGCLNLGMVNPKDKNALDFVRTIANALGYSLAVKPIDPDLYQLALAEYLKHNHTGTPTKENTAPKTSSQKVRDSAMTLVGMSFKSQEDSQINNLDSKATIIADRLEKPAFIYYSNFS